MLNPLKSLNMGEEVEMLRGEEPMRKFNLGLRRGHKIIFVIGHLRIIKNEVVVPILLSLLVLLDGRNTLRIA